MLISLKNVKKNTQKCTPVKVVIWSLQTNDIILYFLVKPFIKNQYS